MKKLAVVCLLSLIGCSSSKYDQDGLQRQIDDLKTRVDAVELSLNYNRVSLYSLQAQVDSLDESNEAEIDQLLDMMDFLQAQVDIALSQLATLQGYANVVSVKDPCGKQGAWDEVLLKLSTGKYLVSFSDNDNGKNTRFALLTDGDYITTDGTKCRFTVSGGGTVVSNERN